MNVRFFRNLGKTGSVGLFAFFAVLAVFSVAVPFTLGSASLGSEVNDRISQDAWFTASAADREVSQLSSQVGTAARDPRLQDPAGMVGDASSPWRHVVDDLNSANGSIVNSAFFDAEGTLLVDSPLDANVGHGFAFRTYFSSAMADPTHVHVSPPFASHLPGAPTVISVSHAVLSAESTAGTPVVSGVIVVSISVSKTLQPMVESLSGSSGIDVSIFDANQKQVVGDIAAQLLNARFSTLLRNAANGSKYQGTFATSAGKYLVSVTPIARTGLVVVVSARNASAFGPLRQFQHRMYGLAGLAGAGMLLGLILLARSVRARDQAVRDAGLSGERTRLILETAGQAFVECDTNGIITGWNAAAETLFGWTRQEAIGQDLHLLLIPDWRREEARGETAQVVAKFSGSTKASKGERLVMRKGEKDPFPAIITMWLTDLAGDLRLSFFVEDVTERRQLDAARELVFRRQRELVEELREADQTKSDFMSTVSHELRTPLTSIVGYLEMLKEGYGGEFTNQGTSMLQVIDRNAHRLLGLIEDLLTLSRIESGQEKTLSSIVDIRFLIVQAQQALLPSVVDNGLTFTVEVADDIAPVEGDANQLERVLLNVLSNAVKFTPDEGRVSIRAWKDQQSVRIEVSDTGIGIPLEEQHRLFSRFFRSTTARDQAIQGTGLGLAIVKSIVDRHGGTIALSSLPSVGTTVAISLPAANVPAVVDR